MVDSHSAQLGASAEDAPAAISVTNQERPDHFTTLIVLRNITRRYSAAVAALDNVSLEIAAGEFVAITGPSGCGKSTLMHLIGGLDTPTAGEIVVAGLPLHRASEAELTAYRRTKLGIVFQFFNLLPTMSVRENICLPLLLRGEPIARARRKADEMIELVGLADRVQHGMHQLSGGQLQRTAIARALVHEPEVLLADEPTGNLDSANAAQVMELLQKISSQRRTTMLVVTHSEEIARSTSRRIRLRDGQIVIHP
jgi:ABC-type lipoprotein export system ATPase subunit